MIWVNVPTIVALHVLIVLGLFLSHHLFPQTTVEPVVFTPSNDIRLLLHTLFLPHPTSIIIPWYEILHHSVFTYECSWLMEGAWWTFFRWLKLTFGSISTIAQLLIARTLTTPEAMHQLRTDVRFWMPDGLDLEVKLNGRTVIGFMDSNHPKPKCQHHQYGIWLRLRFKRKLITSCCRKRHHKLDSSKELATPSSNSSSESHSVKDSNPPDKNYAEEFDRMTAGYKNGIPKCVFRSPTFEEQYGMSSTAAMQLMQDSMHPLDWFGRIKSSYLEAPFKYSSHQQEFHHAFIAASDILFQMGLPRNPLGDRQGAYLQQEPQ